MKNALFSRIVFQVIPGPKALISRS